MYLQASYEQLLPGEPTARPYSGEYASRFDRWESLASVRNKPRRDLGEDSRDLYFPPELHPVVLHPLVIAKGKYAVKTLLLWRLYDYLDFTTELEDLAVIPVATRLARGRSGLILPERMKADAYKIVTDEAWHAQFSYDFTRQIRETTQLPGPVGMDREPAAFIRRLDELREQLPAETRGVEALLFAIVSETLISGILSNIPQDKRLPKAVRDVVRDHAEDEGRHHVYFRSVLKHLWPALTPRERRAIGPHLPMAIYAFLEPDYMRTARCLNDIGLAPDEVRQVISESWPAQKVRAAVASAAGPVTRYFTEVGVLDDARTRASFEESGLLTAEPHAPAGRGKGVTAW